MNTPENPLAGISQRLPPQNLEAEQALLGAILINNRAYDRALDLVAPEHFADPVHGRIFEACARRIGQGRIADAIALRSDLANDALLAEVGGAGYLGQLVAASVAIINAADYARAIRDCWLRRTLIDLAATAVDAAFDPPANGDGTAVLEALEAGLFAMASRGTVRPPPATASVAAQAALQAGRSARRGLVGVPSGLAGLDRKLGGFRPGVLYLIGARPGQGKTALAGTIACRAAAAGKNVLFVTMEMGLAEMGARLLAAQAGVPIEVVDQAGRFGRDQHGRYTFTPNDPSDDQQLDRALAEVAGLPLHIDAVAGLTVPLLRARLRRQMRRPGCDLVIVDYLGLMRASDQAMRKGSTVQEIGEISRDLKIMAMEFGIPVLALTQLNRETEKRENPRPQLSDLRDSGSLEQDASVVMFIFREEEYLERNEPKRRDKEQRDSFVARMDAHDEALANARGKGELIIAKNRQGTKGTIPLWWRGEGTYFLDAEAEPVDAPFFVPSANPTE